MTTTLARPETDVADLKCDLAGLKQDFVLLKWMVGFLLAFQIAISLKLFLP